MLLGPKDYKRLKHGKDTPFDAELQCLKPQLLAQALALLLVWDSPLHEGVLPTGDIRGNWNVTLVPTDV